MRVIRVLQVLGDLALVAQVDEPVQCVNVAFVCGSLEEALRLPLVGGHAIARSQHLCIPDNSLRCPLACSVLDQRGGLLGAALRSAVLDEARVHELCIRAATAVQRRPPVVGHGFLLVGCYAVPV